MTFARCARCDDEFIVGQFDSRKRYCKRACERAARADRLGDRICPADGIVFRSPDQFAKFCSQSCREAALRKPCVTCGASFHPGKYRDLVECRPCRDRPRRQALEAQRLSRIADADRRVAASAAALAIRMAPRPCRECGVVFLPTAQPSLAGRQVYCKAECRERFGRHTATALERKRRGKLVARRFRAMIYERDGGRCYLCGQLIDQDVQWPDTRSPSVDHVMPYSAGGTEDPSNLRATHLGCNMDKGDRLPYWWERLPLQTSQTS